MKMRAILSPCRTWRYLLECDFETLGPTIAFGLHNPSTATAEEDDPTWRRGRGFAQSWGAGKVIYVNPWAGRATSPRDLWTLADPIGPDNDRHIANVAHEVVETRGFFVFAWGAIAPPQALRYAANNRLHAFNRIVRDAGCEIRALGTTKAGQPRHPLYLAKDTQLEPWRMLAA